MGVFSEVGDSGGGASLNSASTLAQMAPQAGGTLGIDVEATSRERGGDSKTTLSTMIRRFDTNRAIRLLYGIRFPLIDESFCSTEAPTLPPNLS